MYFLTSGEARVGWDALTARHSHRILNIPWNMSLKAFLDPQALLSMRQRGHTAVNQTESQLLTVLVPTALGEEEELRPTGDLEKCRERQQTTRRGAGGKLCGNSCPLGTILSDHENADGREVPRDHGKNLPILQHPGCVVGVLVPDGIKQPEHQ